MRESARATARRESKTRVVLPDHRPAVAESDARYGGFDFRAAHEAAPADLRELLDNTESLPFRRRGYERDGMLR